MFKLSGTAHTNKVVQKNDSQLIHGASTQNVHTWLPVTLCLLKLGVHVCNARATQSCLRLQHLYAPPIVEI